MKELLVLLFAACALFAASFAALFLASRGERGAERDCPASCAGCTRSREGED